MKRARTVSLLAVLLLLALGGLAQAIELGAVTIRNGSGSSVGRIDRDGTIRNGSGSSVGRIDGYSPGLRHMVAAVLFFGGSVSVLKL
jgi:hypothetical protein